MTAPPKIAVVGSINVDIVVRAPRLPMAGETVHGDSFAMTLGGKGANQAVAAARMGGDVAFLARTGADDFGVFARRQLERFDLSTRFVSQSASSGTGIATIGVDSTGQNAITIVAGANGTLVAADIEAVAETIRGAGVLLLQCEVPLETSLAAARIARQAGVPVIFDPAPVPDEGIAAFAGLVDYLTPNETEASRLTGLPVTNRAEALVAASALRAEGFATVIVKCGGNGLAFATGDSGGEQGPIPVIVEDTVAAGDCFNAGFAVALASARPFRIALDWARASGALAVTRKGAAEAAPTQAEVAALLAAQGLSA